MTVVQKNGVKIRIGCQLAAYSISFQSLVDGWGNRGKNQVRLIEIFFLMSSMFLRNSLSMEMRSFTVCTA